MNRPGRLSYIDEGGRVAGGGSAVEDRGGGAAGGGGEGKRLKRLVGREKIWGFGDRIGSARGGTMRKMGGVFEVEEIAR